MHVVFTVCNRLTLAGAQVLADSVSRYEPDSRFFLCWVDTLPLPELPSNIKVLYVKELNIPGWEEMCNRYFDFELVAACRPWFGKFLMANIHEAGVTLTFLAPTTVLFGPIGSLPSDMEFALTPNITSPLAENSKLDDKRILNIGMFNAGAWMMKKTEGTVRFLQWWATRTFDRARYDLCNGMCMDQLWLNYALVWVPAAYIRREATWHYGLRSAVNFELQERDGVYYVDNQKLTSLDFSGLIGNDPVWFDQRALLSKNRVFRRLFKEYELQIRALSLRAEENNPGYGTETKLRVTNKRLLGLLEKGIQFIDKV